MITLGNNMRNYFYIFKYNMKLRKEYYIGLVDNDNANGGYNIINKTGKAISGMTIKS